MELLDFLGQAVEKGASDLFIIAGSPVCMKLDNKLCPIGGDRLLPENCEKLIGDLYTQANRTMDIYLGKGDDDFSLTVPGMARFRVNTYRQRSSMAAVIRVVAFGIPDWQTLGIPAQVMNLAKVRHGMILVTGTAGSGKSTTQACIIDRINQTRDCHIITMENPIEYLHRNVKSIVSQREVTIDTKDYLSGLRACLRQAPDVILLGEMRDHETIQTAMTAAETGHLIIATLHTQGAVNTIDRIVDSFPSTQQAQVRIQLSSVLNTVVSQQLLPATDGGLVAAFEVMDVDSGGIRAMIRDSKSHMIDNAIASGNKEVMFSMDDSILNLYKAGKITRETALGAAANKGTLERRMG